MREHNKSWMQTGEKRQMKEAIRRNNGTEKDNHLPCSMYNVQCISIPDIPTTSIDDFQIVLQYFLPSASNFYLGPNKRSNF